MSLLLRRVKRRTDDTSVLSLLTFVGPVDGRIPISRPGVMLEIQTLGVRSNTVCEGSGDARKQACFGEQIPAAFFNIIQTAPAAGTERFRRYLSEQPQSPA
jgi:hypothetical protein